MKKCVICDEDFVKTFTRRIVCSDQCKAENVKNVKNKRNKRVGKNDNGSGIEQAEVRFKNKFLFS